MAGGDYYLCEVCGRKALYDHSDDNRQDVVVMHAACMWQDRADREKALREQIAGEAGTVAASMRAGMGHPINSVVIHPPPGSPDGAALARAVVETVQHNVRLGRPPLTGIS